MIDGHQQPRGYILLLVMLLIAITAAAMASVCRLALQKAVQAGRAEDELRWRWAVITCRAAMLPKAEAVLSSDGNTASEVRRPIRLGTHNFTLIFGDEQAKANVNLLYANAGLAGAERGVRALVGASGAPVPVELRAIPARGKLFGSPEAVDDSADSLPAFESFGQVLGRAPPGRLVEPRGNRPSLTSHLTCWGSGALHFQLASKEAVRAVLTADLEEDIGRLLDARAKNPHAESAELLDALDLSGARRERVEYLLVDNSACHSLWIIGDSGDRIRYDLSIADGAAVTMFSW